jgi:hypothetical protein
MGKYKSYLMEHDMMPEIEPDQYPQAGYDE